MSVLYNMLYLSDIYNLLFNNAVRQKTHMNCLRAFIVSICACMAFGCKEEGRFEKGRSAELVELIIGVPDEEPTHSHRGYPKPDFRIEPEPEKAPRVMVPNGTKNIALGKSVSASNAPPIIGDLSYITDGIKRSDDGDFVELMEGLQWVQIDLEQPVELHAIWICRKSPLVSPENDVAHDVTVQLSSKPDFSGRVVTVFNNDFDDSSQLGRGSDLPYYLTRYGKLISFDAFEARYVRVYSNGSVLAPMNRYLEIEVYGREPGSNQ